MSHIETLYHTLIFKIGATWLPENTPHTYPGVHWTPSLCNKIHILYGRFIHLHPVDQCHQSSIENIGHSVVQFYCFQTMFNTFFMLTWNIGGSCFLSFPSLIHSFQTHNPLAIASLARAVDGYDAKLLFTDLPGNLWTWDSSDLQSASLGRSKTSKPRIRTFGKDQSEELGCSTTVSQ